MKKVTRKSHKSPLSRQKRKRKALEQRRLKAANLFKKGKAPSEIARIFGVSAEAARQWKVMWQEKGVQGLKSKGKPGPKPRLTETDRDKVEQALLRGPKTFGYATNIWTLKRIAKVIRKVVGIKHGQTQVWRILCAMNWTCQKPKKRVKERNEAVILAWKRNSWPAIKKRGETCRHTLGF